jgi:integrase
MGRRVAGDGGLTRKTRRWTNKDTGEITEHSYWEASAEVPAKDLPAGMNRKRVTGSGSSKTQALERLKLNMDSFTKGEARRGKTRLSAKVTVQRLFDEWDSNNKSGAVSPTMAWKYEGYFKNHILPALGTRRLDSLTETDLNLFFNQTLPSKKDAHGNQLLAAPSRRNIYMALSGCLQFAVRNNYIAVNPLRAVRAPKKSKPNDDIDAVLADSRKILDWIQSGNHPDEARWLLAYLGLRKGERLGLSWDNIRGLDSNNPSLVINQQLAWDKGTGLHLKPPKNGKTRVIPLAEPWVSALKRYRKMWNALPSNPSWKEPKEEFKKLLFLQNNGYVIDPNDDNEDWKALLKEINVKPWRPHLARHVTATMLAERPQIPISTVMSILGHNTEAMTVYYAHIGSGRNADSIRDFGEAIAGKKSPVRKRQAASKKR